MVAALRRSRVDDDDLHDDFDPAYFPRRVYRDGRGPTVRLMLTDAAPSANDAHRPHQVGVVDGVELRDAERAARAAYDERSFRLENSWRGPATPMLPPLRDGQSARDAYIERVTNAWRAPPRRNDPADDVEALQRRWASPGATPGPGRRPAQDAGPSSDADQAYEEYCARLQAAWKTR
jgi:hypothetical protein